MGIYSSQAPEGNAVSICLELAQARPRLKLEAELITTSLNDESSICFSKNSIICKFKWTFLRILSVSQSSMMECRTGWVLSPQSSKGLLTRVSYVLGECICSHAGDISVDPMQMQRTWLSFLRL